MFKALLQPFQLLLNGATGKDRLEKRLLSQRLVRLETDYDRLQRDMDELLSYADEETEKLSVNSQKLRSQLKHIRAENKELREQNEALQSQVIFLNQKIEALQTHKNQSQSSAKKRPPRSQSSPSPPLPSAASPPSQQSDLSPDPNLSIDLSNVSLALIGGHETTHREVSEELKKYGLKRCIHIPPHSIVSNSRSQIKDKISNCDLIVTITSYVDHSVTQCVKQLKDTQMLTGEVIRVHCHGKSGVVREVLDYFSN